MSTRSMICKATKEDGKYLSAYCHWNGYPENNGLILFEHYQDEKKIDKLLSFGDMSSLDALVEPKTDGHSFDCPEHGVTVFYGRDRGETGTEAKIRTKDELWDSWAEYVYIWRNGEWYVDEGDGEGEKLLRDVLRELGVI